MKLAREVAGQVKVVTNGTKRATDRLPGRAPSSRHFRDADDRGGQRRGPQPCSSWFYIGRNLVARLVGLEKTMTRLASGDLSAEIGAKQRWRRDRSRWPKLLSVFREEASSRANAAAAEKSREQEAKQKQAAARSTSSRGSSMTAPLTRWHAVSTAASRMKGSAEKMPAHVAAQAKEQTSAGRLGVGPGGGERPELLRPRPKSFLARSPRFPGRSPRSSRIAAQAVEQVARSEVTVTELANAANRIGEVVGLINDHCVARPICWR